MIRSIIAFSLVLIAFSISPSFAASEPRLIATHGDWKAYTFRENGNKVCYMAAQPKKAIGNYTKRGKIYALITHRPAENTKDVFSYIAGYPYKGSSDVNVKIDAQNFVLFTQNDTAWAPDSPMDVKLARAIQKGSDMVVNGTSSRGTLTTDTFSLSGSSKAYRTISEECGL